MCVEGEARVSIIAGGMKLSLAHSTHTCPCTAEGLCILYLQPSSARPASRSSWPSSHPDCSFVPTLVRHFTPFAFARSNDSSPTPPADTWTKCYVVVGKQSSTFR